MEHRLSASLQPLEPRIIGIDLFAELDGRLIELLSSLSQDDWHRPTVCSEWTVKDIASHILDTSCRRLSSGRDHYQPKAQIESPATDDSIIRNIHRTNAQWTAATERLSPRLLMDFLRLSLPESAKFLTSLDPFGKGVGVMWAGESSSCNWFDVAREYTERWHHQQQIAVAVGRSSGITSRRLYYPVLETFMRALPFTLRESRDPVGTSMRVSITGEAGGTWYAHQSLQGWVLSAHGPSAATSSAIVPQEDAWLLFTKRWDRQTKMARFPGVIIEGDLNLGARIWDMLSIMA